MDDRTVRDGRATEPDPAVGADSDIRRAFLMMRDLHDVPSAAPLLLRRGLHWGPVWSGVMTSLVISFLLGCLFLAFGVSAANAGRQTFASAMFNWASGLALAIGVFVGAYLTGYVADKHSRTEGLIDGFMVGVMTILMPIALAATSLTLAPPAGIIVTAGSAWGIFWAGVVILVLATLGGAVGYRNAERALSHELRLARTQPPDRLG